MMDPTQPAVGLKLLATVKDRSVKVPGFEYVTDSISVSFLGAGESYAAWRLTNEANSVVVRMPRRPPEEMPGPMTDEFNAAPLIADDVGSRAIAMDASSENALGSPYIVSTFVAGTVLPASDWDARLLLEHARQLAKLHVHKFELAGPVGGEGSVFDLAQEFEDGFQWWQKAHPEIIDEPGIATLAAEVRKALAAAAADFEGIRYSFIHGDMVATNVVVDSSGIPRYIDWEWARIGDVAQDLAYIGGSVFGGPWYAQMDASMVNRFLIEYLRAAAEHPPHGLESFEQLRRRRDAWEVYERFLSSLHFMKQSQTLAEPGYYPEAVRSLHATLRTRLGIVG